MVLSEATTQVLMLQLLLGKIGYSVCLLKIFIRPVCYLPIRHDLIVMVLHFKGMILALSGNIRLA
jgi:hypothetical protein